MGVCLVEDWGFRPGGVHSHFLPHNLYSFPVHIVGTPGEVSAPGQLSGFHQAAQKSFSGAFQNSNPNLHFYCLPHQHISLFKNQAPSKVKCHRTAFCRDQTVTERPVRPRVSAPAIVEILAYVFMCHTPVTLIKSTYLLTIKTFSEIVILPKTGKKRLAVFPGQTMQLFDGFRNRS